MQEQKQKSKTDQPRNINLDIPDQINNLVNIGIKKEDFESIPSNGKSYTLLGKGNFGFAEKVKSKLNNKLYAIKKLSIKDLKTKDFIRETTIMMNLNHQYIVKLYGYFKGVESIVKLKEIYFNDPKGRFKDQTEDIDMVYLVMDCMINGSLETYLNNYRKENKMVEQSFIMKIFEQLLKALKYLQEKSLMHRDIKLDNILLDENYNIKISDFGISAVYKDNKTNLKIENEVLYSNKTVVGRRDFVAPEIMNREDYDYGVDIFSLGLTILCLMSKTHPILLDERRKRTINCLLMYEEYNKYLKMLVLTMILGKNLRPEAKEALNELDFININISKPENDMAAKTIEDKLKQTFAQYEIEQKTNFPQNNQQININKFLQNNNQSFLFQKRNSDNLNGQNIPNMPINIPNIPQQQIPISSSAGQIYQINNTIKSLLSVLKCLYYCFQKNNLIYLINALQNSNLNQSYSLLILNNILFLENDYDVNIINNKYIDLKNRLGQKMNIFANNSIPRPSDIYQQLISIFIQETCNFNFGFNNINFHPNLNLNLNNFPEANNILTNFFKVKAVNPFFNFFYYLALDIAKCSQCSNIYGINAYQNNDLKFPGFFTGNISNIVPSCFKIDNEEYDTCNHCGMNAKKICNRYLISLPQFLVINFIGKEMGVKSIDFNLNISSYLYPGMNMNALYDLFAFIHKINGEYCTYIYFPDGWYYFDNRTLIKINNVVNFTQIYAYFIIYKLRN